MSFWAGAGGGLLGGGFSLLGGLGQSAFNAHEADKNRKFQAYMANTQYQRAVADLKAAGLNPIMAASSGMKAGMPGGAQAQAGNLTGFGTEALNSARIARLMSAETRKAEQEADKAMSEARIAWNESNWQSDMYHLARTKFPWLMALDTVSRLGGSSAASMARDAGVGTGAVLGGAGSALGHLSALNPIGWLTGLFKKKAPQNVQQWLKTVK